MLPQYSFHHLIPQLIAGVALAVSSLNSVAGSPTTLPATVISSSESGCGSHGGSFDALYKNRKMSVFFEFNPTPANPVERPIKVFWQKRQIITWDYFICAHRGEPHLLAGREIFLYGRWIDSKRSSFFAETISLFNEGTRQKWAPSFDCSKASTHQEMLICSNKELSEADVRLSHVLQDAYSSTKDKKSLSDGQKRWLREGRDTCIDAQCMIRSYNNRISELSR